VATQGVARRTAAARAAPAGCCNGGRLAATEGDGRVIMEHKSPLVSSFRSKIDLLTR